MTEPVNFNHGLTGIRNGLDGINRTAAEIASKDVMQAEKPQDLASAMVDLKVYEHQVNASAMVVKITNRVLGSLLDIKA